MVKCINTYLHLFTACIKISIKSNLRLFNQPLSVMSVLFSSMASAWVAAWWNKKSYSGYIPGIICYGKNKLGRDIGRCRCAVS